MRHRVDLGQYLSAMFFPATCAACGERGTWLCDRCAAKVPAMASLPGLCARCGLPQLQRQCGCRDLHPKIITSRSLYPFIGWVGASLRGIKYEGERDRAAFVGALLASVPSCCRLIEAADYIVPVPVHDRRERERGYNQARLLADAACMAVGREPSTQLLHRVRASPSQVDVSGDERRQNVRGAFALVRDVHVSAGSRIVVFDDVRTTGATVSACADAFGAAKPSRIDVVTVAAELRHDVLRRLGLAGV